MFRHGTLAEVAGPEEMVGWYLTGYLGRHGSDVGQSTTQGAQRVEYE